jgi:hypothetical protein
MKDTTAVLVMVVMVDAGRGDPAAKVCMPAITTTTLAFNGVAEPHLVVVVIIEVNFPLSSSVFFFFLCRIGGSIVCESLPTTTSALHRRCHRTTATPNVCRCCYVLPATFSSVSWYPSCHPTIVSLRVSP